MFKRIGVQEAVVLFLIAVLPGSWTTMAWGANKEATKPLDAKTVLEKAEGFIRPWKAGSVDVAMSYKKNGQVIRQTFKAYYSDSKALVVFQSPENEIGNLLLLIDNDMWYYEKGTSQAVNVPALHKTAGQLPCVDIPRLVWAKDYTAEIGKNIDMIDRGPKDPTAIKISIKATSKGLTYKQGDAWIDEETFHPIQANLYFGSGKCARTVKFTEFVSIAGKMAVREIQVIDHLNLGKTYTLTYDNFEPKEPPERYFSESQLPALAKELAPAGESGKALVPDDPKRTPATPLPKYPLINLEK